MVRIEFQSRNFLHCGALSGMAQAASSKSVQDKSYTSYRLTTMTNILVSCLRIMEI